MISSTASRFSRFLAPGARQLQRHFQESRVRAQSAAGHDVVEHRHAAEQRDVLEGAGDAEMGGMRRRHVRQPLAAEGDAAFLRHVDAVDDVEHRALAGAVRADDGADLVLEHIEGDVGQRLHAAEAQRDRVELEDRRAERERRAATTAGWRWHGNRHVQAALRVCAGATTFASRIFTSSGSAADTRHAALAVIHRVHQRTVSLGDDVDAAACRCASARRRRRSAPCPG